MGTCGAILPDQSTNSSPQFNMETPDSDSWTKEGREPYKSISAPRPTLQLEIQVLLTGPDTLANNQVLVYVAPDSSRVRVEPTPNTFSLRVGYWLLTQRIMTHLPQTPMLRYRRYTNTAFLYFALSIPSSVFFQPGRLLNAFVVREDLPFKSGSEAILAVE